MPESRHKYLYERLGDHDFQQLVAALLAAQFPDFVPMALRQADGGRDGLRDLEPGKVLIYQVKWSVSGKEKDPVTWLDKSSARRRRTCVASPRKASGGTCWLPTCPAPQARYRHLRPARQEARGTRESIRVRRD